MRKRIRHSITKLKLFTAVSVLCSFFFKPLNLTSQPITPLNTNPEESNAEERTRQQEAASKAEGASRNLETKGRDPHPSPPGAKRLQTDPTVNREGLFSITWAKSIIFQETETRAKPTQLNLNNKP